MMFKALKRRITEPLPAKVNRRRQKIGRYVALGIDYLILILFCLFVLLPYLIVVSTSFKTLMESTRIPFHFIPWDFTVDAYVQVLREPSIWRGLLNTLIVVVPPMFVGIFTSSLSAYAFSKIRFPASKVMFTILLMTMMLPGVVTMVPAYVIYDLLGWIDTYWPLMLPEVFGGISCVFYLRQYFNGLPDELGEAARLDGLSYFGTFLWIFLPLAKPACVAQLILWFVGGYNNYFGPMLYLNSEIRFTLQLVVNLMAGGFDNNWPKVMAATIVMIIPMLIFYVTMQKYFVEGIAMSGLKA